MCEKWITYNINHVFPTKTKCQNILNFIVQFINKHSIIHPQNYITISILTCKICRFIKPIGNVHNVSTWKFWTFERSHIPCPDILRDSEVQETYQLCFFLKFGCCPIAFFLFSRLRKKKFFLLHSLHQPIYSLENKLNLISFPLKLLKEKIKHFNPPP